MDSTSTKELTITGYWRRVLDPQNSTGSPRYYVLSKLVKAVIWLAHGNAEVQRSLSVKSKALTSERSLLSDDSINASTLSNDAIRVTGSRQAHKILITASLMQARRLLMLCTPNIWKKRRICNRRPRLRYTEHTKIVGIQKRSLLEMHKGTGSTRTIIAHSRTPLS